MWIISTFSHFCTVQFGQAAPKLLLVYSLLLLSACASGPSKPDQDAIVVGSQDAIAIHPSVEQDFQEALALLKEKKYDQAITLLESIVRTENRITAPFVNLGIAYMRTGEMEKAEQNLLKAVSLDPAHPIANNELGLLYRKTGRFAKARKVYEETLKIYPDFLPVRKNLAILCDIYLDDLGCALSQFQKLAKALPKDEKLKIWIAEIKARRER